MKARFLIFLWFLFCFNVAGMGLNERYEKARQLQSEGRFAHALKLYREILKFRPQAFEVSNRAAVCFEKLGYPQLAYRYYQKALEYRPQSTVAREGSRRVAQQVQSQDREEQQDSNSVQIRIRTQEARVVAPETSQSRLWFVRSGSLYTMLRNGSSQRLYSEVRFGALDRPTYPFGWLSTRKGEFSELNIHWFDGRTGILHPVLNSSQDEFSPVHTGERTFHYLTNKEGRNQWFRATLNSAGSLATNTQPVPTFYEPLSLVRASRGVFVLGRRNRIEPQKVWLYSKTEGLIRKSPGTGEDDGVVASSDPGLFALRRVSDSGRRNFLLISETNSMRRKFPNEPADLLEGVFSKDAKNFYVASARRHEKEGWLTVVSRVHLPTGEVAVLHQSNFVIQNPLVDEKEEYFYYLTDYDGNFEVYRLPIRENATPERLTLSSAEDELQLGFWSFPSY